MLYWNIRGIGNLDSRLILQKLCVSQRPDFLFIAELWIDFDRVPCSFWRKLNLKLFVTNTRDNSIPSLWGLCLMNLTPFVISVTSQQVSFSVDWDCQKVFVSAVYASTCYILRRQLWMDLASLQQNHPSPWGFLGDFNAVLGAHEKCGGRLPLMASCEDFRGWTDSCFLTHLVTRGRISLGPMGVELVRILKYG